MTKRHRNSKHGSKRPSKAALLQDIRRDLDSKGNLSAHRYKDIRKTYVGALKHFPLAITKLFENMPMPWELSKTVQTLYHNAGCLTVVNDTARCIPEVYRAKWALTLREMQNEYHNRTHFTRLEFPLTDDDDSIRLYHKIEKNFNVQSAIPIYDSLSDEYRELVEGLFNEAESSVNGKRQYTTSLEQKKILDGLCENISSNIDPNSYFLFNTTAFLNAKVINGSVSGGPRFDPFKHNIESIYENINDFNDVTKVINRGHSRIEYRCLYPYLHSNSRTHPFFMVDQYRHSLHVNIETDELGFETTLHPQRKANVPKGPKLPFAPLFAEEELEPVKFNLLTLEHKKKTQRQVEQSIVRLHQQHCSPNVGVSTKVAHQRVLKVDAKRALSKEKRKAEELRQDPSTLEFFSQSKFFKHVEMDWLEAAMQLVHQGWNILNLIIHKKKLNFLHLDYNFNLKAIKTLTTKERKRGRLGHMFDIIRELLKFTKFIVDAHIQFRLGLVDSFQLHDAIYTLFLNMGKHTGLYRYKYRVMRQITLFKNYNKIICRMFSDEFYDRKYTGSFEIMGNGFWVEFLREYVFMLRGFNSMLTVYATNFLSRLFEGRDNYRIKTISKARSESHYDLELKLQLERELKDILPPRLHATKIKHVLSHYSEAWRCMRAGVVFRPQLPQPVIELLNAYLEERMEWYQRNTLIERKKLAKGFLYGKKDSEKNSGRLIRLYFLFQQELSNAYLESGPFIAIDQALAIYKGISAIVTRFVDPVAFPPLTYTNDSKILVLAIEALKEQFVVKPVLNQREREELALIDRAFESPSETLNRIKRLLLTQRTFRKVDVTVHDHIDTVDVVYNVDPLEKITDAYIAMYLNYELRRFLPKYSLPVDSVPMPLSVHEFCAEIAGNRSLMSSKSQFSCVCELSVENFFANIDLNLLNKILRLFMDDAIADYITSRCNVEVDHKDSSYLNVVGVLKGFEFSALIGELCGLVLDLLLLGRHTCEEFVSASIEGRPAVSYGIVQHYRRTLDKVYIVCSFTPQEATYLVNSFIHNSDEHTLRNLPSYQSKIIWPVDQRMMMNRVDDFLGRAVFEVFSKRVPKTIATIEFEKSFISVSSPQNPHFNFEMGGFEIRLLPASRIDEVQATDINTNPQWTFNDHSTGESMMYGWLRVSEKAQARFTNRIRRILMTSSATTFMKIASRWNQTLLGFVSYYREAIPNTVQLIDKLIKCENRVQLIIKKGFNSKMPNRFPPVVFYAPREFGGLGMYSIGSVLVPVSDFRFASQTDAGIVAFRSGLNQDSVIPNLYRYVASWQDEITQSRRVWYEHDLRRREAELERRRLTYDDVEDLVDYGVPRVKTLFSSQRSTLLFEFGWRKRQLFSRYTHMRYDPFNWTSYNHDGRLFDIDQYRTDVISSLGGPEVILSHTMFRATHFGKHEGLFWEKQSAFEKTSVFRNLTHAQRRGVNQLSNRRFILWWSPTINRADVYVGFKVQLDLCGVFLHGKIAGLRVAVVELFAGHLWQRVHESLVMDLTQYLNNKLEALDIEKVVQQSIQPRKSYRYEASAADITLNATYKWPFTEPMLMSDVVSTRFDTCESSKFWIDVQLRWGDYDAHDISLFAKQQFLRYTHDGVTKYPSYTGIVIAYDLCYDCYAIYGTFFPGLQQALLTLMRIMHESNTALSVFRERIRNQLSLYNRDHSTTLLSSNNLIEIFNQKLPWLVDESIVYRKALIRTENGNVHSDPMNGALFVFIPTTGELNIRTIHKSAWANMKRLSQIARWKAAEEVSALLKALPSDDLPTEIFSTTKTGLSPLQTRLIDFPNIKLRGSEMQVMFSALLMHPMIGPTIQDATESHIAVYNLYDDWLESWPQDICFIRLCLLLRGIKTSQRSVQTYLTTHSLEVKPGHVWPSLTDAEWIDFEKLLRDIVVDDVAKKMDVSSDAFTAGDIRDIVLGMQIEAPDSIRAKMAEMTEERESTEERIMETVNKSGETLGIKVTTNYETEKAVSRAEWRQRMTESHRFKMQADNIVVGATKAVASLDHPAVELPMPALRQFIKLFDSRVEIGALLYGRIFEDIIRVYAVVLPLQWGDSDSVTIPLAKPNSFVLEQLQCVGWMHSSTVETKEASMHDMLLHRQFIVSGRMPADSVQISISPSCIVSCFSFVPTCLDFFDEVSKATNDILEFDRQYKRFTEAQDSTFERKVLLSTEFSCCFMVPQLSKGFWNANFTSTRQTIIGHTADDEYEVVASIPLDFYAPEHRKTHFFGLSDQ
ncbi:hypothetical protein PCE1_000511 [Barthelona sp. PCE]